MQVVCRWYSAYSPPTYQLHVHHRERDHRPFRRVHRRSAESTESTESTDETTDTTWGPPTLRLCHPAERVDSSVESTSVPPVPPTESTLGPPIPYIGLWTDRRDHRDRGPPVGGLFRL